MSRPSAYPIPAQDVHRLASRWERALLLKRHLAKGAAPYVLIVTVHRDSPEHKETLEETADSLR